MTNAHARESGGDVPAGARVLMYHSVSRESDRAPHLLRVHPRVLDRHLTHLRRRRLRGVSVAEWLAAVSRGEGSRLAPLTFDDGYLDFTQDVMPLLAKHGMTGTVYVVAGKLGGQSDWSSRGLHSPLMDTAAVLAAAEAGHEVGSHTMTHPRLPELAAHEQFREVTESKQMLESVLQRPVSGFAYPYGAFDQASMEAVEAAGYSYACTTDDHTRPGRFTIARFFVGQRDTPLRLEAKFIRHRLRAAAHAAES